LKDSRTKWNIIAQQVFIAQHDSMPGPERQFQMDQWNGYTVARKRFLEFLHKHRPSNPVVLTGDIHVNWVADLKLDFDREDSPVVGTEFVGTSISSSGNGADMTPNATAALSENPHLKFFNGQRGYVRCSLTPERWQTDYRVVPTVSQPDATISTRASFVVENGRPGAKKI
ncbi:MAG TPA: alkaline phosphatase D family protein, partial [Blastocatellia bacterium]|nr:alkaline phosphatase D family protein [Blastocatellia bacterium]